LAQDRLVPRASGGSNVSDFPFPGARRDERRAQKLAAVPPPP